MKQLFRVILLPLIAIPLIAFSATKDEAKALAEKAAALINAEGVEAARAKLHDPKGEFIDGELYIFVIDFTGNTLVHGGKPSQVGENLIKIKDPDGVFFLREMIDVVKKYGSGWVKYLWTNPETNKVTQKITYVLRLKESDALVGCGVYE